MDENAYVFIIDGKETTVENMTREQLIAELMKAVDVIEAIDTIQSETIAGMATVIDRWRFGG
jgi:hypothetical protein